MDADIKGEDVVIFGEEGYNISASVTEHLADQNDMTFLTPRTGVFQETLHTFERRTIFEQLYETGVEFVPKHSLRAVEG